MELGTFVSKALPWIGAAATGNVPALVAMAAREVSDVLGAKVDPSLASIEAAVRGATPEQMAELKKAEWDFQARMQEAGYRHVEQLASIDLQVLQADKADVAGARASFSKDDRVFWLAWTILGAFSVGMLIIMVGCYLLLTSAVMKDADPSTVAVAAGMIGTLMGYLAANVQQVVSYFFGSSQGSKNSGDAVRQSLQEMLKQLAGRKVS
jgi:hypothetical protein